MGTGSPIARFQTSVSFDPSNVTGLASDDNSGVDDTRPLLTYGEWIRRLGAGCDLQVVQNWRVLSNAVEAQIDFSSVSTSLAIPSGKIQVAGVPTRVYLGTVTAFGTGPWTITDAGAAGSWTSRGCVSTPAAGGSRLIRKTSGNVRAFVRADNGGNQAQITISNSIAEDLNNFTYAQANFANGDQYEVVSLPTFPAVIKANRIAVYSMLLDHSTFTWVTQTSTRLCGFALGGLALKGDTFSSGNALYGCFLHGGSSQFNGKATADLCSWSCPTGGMQFAFFNGDWNTCVNEFYNTIVLASHQTFARLGTLNVYNCPDAALRLDNSALIDLDGIVGNGNTGHIITVRDPGCQVRAISGWSAFTATTSAAHPLQVCGVDFDYANLGSTAYIAGKNAGFFG